ncbi:MAG: peptidase MA family metallohydrolase [Terriglobia bacterium]
MIFRLLFRLGLVPLLAGLATLAATADAIVLKNGRRIEAGAVEERDDWVYYETPAGRIGIPRRLVERIERSDAQPKWASPQRPGSVRWPAAELPARNDADVLRVVEAGELDLALLTKLESAARRSGSQPARRRAAAAHAVAAQFLAAQGDAAGAADSLRRALEFAPNHPRLLLNLATLEVEQQRYAAALVHLRPLLTQKEFAFEAYRLQGWIYYQREEMQRAIAAWKRALAKRPDPELEARLAQAETEARAAERYRQRASGRFVLRYPAGELAAPRLAASILGALDSMHADMANAFDVFPRAPIVVLLYPNQTFYDITGLPPWVHAVYDGKIRLPIRGMVSLTLGLKQVLRHELAHAFVFIKSAGRAPRWLQEGLAQWHAGQRPAASRQSFRRLFEPRDGSALAGIAAAFAGDPAQVTGAYAASWLVVDTLFRRYGRGDMERFLEALAGGARVEQGLRRAFRLTFVDLDRAVYDALR